MSIHDDLRLAIDKNLSAEVGAALKERLIEADSNADKVKTLRRQVDDLSAKLQCSESQRISDREREERIKKLAELEEATRKATVDKTIVDLKLEFAAARVFDMKELVKDVFGNSRFKYTVMENGSMPVAPGPNYAPPISASTSKTTTVEGTGPVPGTKEV